MNSIKKWAIGLLAGTALLAGAIALSKNKETKREPPRVERTISWENPQRSLNEAYRNLRPENISEVTYDPEFSHSDKHIKNRLVGYSRRLTESYLQSARSQSPNHVMCISEIIEDIGDGQKRPVFARRSLLSSPGVQCEADLESALHHEDIHARESRYGYDFDGENIKGTELKKIFDSGEIRPEVIIDIGEFDAYSSQLARAQKTERRPSAAHIALTTLTVLGIYDKLEVNAKIGTLSPLERRYFETKKRKHREVIETLKNYR